MTTAQVTSEAIQQWKAAGDQDATNQLLSVLQTCPEPALRAEAATALASLHGVEPHVPLVTMLSNEQQRMRMLAAEALGEIQHPEVSEALTKSVSDTDPAVRATAALALGRNGDPEVLETLTRLLSDPVWVVQLAAAQGLADLGEASAFSVIVDWSRRFFELPIPELNAAGKVEKVYGLMGTLLRKLPEEDLWLHTANVGKKSEVRTIKGTPSRIAEANEWIHETHDDPIGVGIRAELARRKSENGQGPQTPALEASELNNETPLPADVQAPSVDDVLTDLNGSTDDASEIGDSPIGNGADPLDDILGDAPGTAASDPAPPSPAGDALDDILGEEAPSESAPAEPESEPEESPSDETVVSEDPEHLADEAPTESAQKDIEKTPEPLPEPDGVIAKFLSLLQEAGIESIYVCGTPVVEALRGESPTHIQLALHSRIAAEQRKHTGDPLKWNGFFAEVAEAELNILAERLDCSIDDLLTGEATFESLPVTYEGPYLLESIEQTPGRRQIGRVINQKFSRIGMVTDRITKQTQACVVHTSLDRIGYAPNGKPVGESALGHRDLLDGVIHVDSTPGRLSLVDVLHVLTQKHKLHAKLSDEAIDILEAAADVVRENPKESCEEFDMQDLEAAAEVSNTATIAGELELLGLIDVLKSCLSDEEAQEIDETLASAREDREKSLHEKRDELDSAKKTLEEKSTAYQDRTKEFNELASEGEKSQAELNENEDLRNELQARLAESEQAARTARGQVDDATKKMREMTAAGEQADVSVIHAHRDALKAKKEADQTVAKLRGELESKTRDGDTIEKQVEEIQEKMESIGQQLESSLTEFKDATAGVETTQAELAKMESDLEMTDEKKREQLRVSAASE